MKRIQILILLIAILTIFFSGCTSETEESEVTLLIKPSVKTSKQSETQHLSGFLRTMNKQHSNSSITTSPFPKVSNKKSTVGKSKFSNTTSKTVVNSRLTAYLKSQSGTNKKSRIPTSPFPSKFNK